jgi:hypothetical protein
MLPSTNKQAGACVPLAQFVLHTHRGLWKVTRGFPRPQGKPLCVVNAASGFLLFSRPVTLSPLLEVFLAGKGQVLTSRGVWLSSREEAGGKETMNDMRMWSPQFITEFVEMCKSFPCLYDIKSKEYSNKQLKMLHMENW